MKISKLFHWLYFIVMMLPVFVIPCFGIALRSDNNYQPITLTIQETTPRIQYTYMYQTNSVETENDVLLGNIYFIESMEFDFGMSSTFEIFLPKFDEFWWGTESEPVLSYIYRGEDDWYTYRSNSYNALTDGGLVFHYSVNDVYILYTSGDVFVKVDFPVYFYGGFENADFIVLDGLNDFRYFIGPSWSEYYLSIEPSDFNVITSASLVYDSTTPVTYNDTDIGSQMVYTMYQGVNKYFNFDNVFNFGDLYTWLQTTFFNGTAPLGFFIFWHLLIYWLLISLLWLLFDVLIYVPMLIHRWLDKASLS